MIPHDKRRVISSRVTWKVSPTWFRARVTWRFLILVERKDKDDFQDRDESASVIQVGFLDLQATPELNEEGITTGDTFSIQVGEQERTVFSFLREELQTSPLEYMSGGGGEKKKQLQNWTESNRKE